MADEGNEGIYVADSRLLVDGEAQTYERIATVHGEPRERRFPHRISLTRYDDIATVTKRRDVHSMDPDSIGVIANALGAGRPLIPLMLDGDDHTKYRKLLDPLFAPKQIARLEPMVRELA